MKILDKIREYTDGARAAVATVQGNIAELRRAIDGKRAEIRDAEAALPPPDELTAHAARLVAEAGGRWWADHGAALLQRLAGRWVNPALAATGGSVRPRAPELPWSFTEALPFGALCSLFPDLVTAGLRAVIEAHAYDAGAPTAERPALVARLEAELRELEAREEQLVDEACAAGVTIAHRQEVVARRNQEARQRQIAGAAEAERAERERQVNETHQRRSTAAPSPYLEAQKLR